MAITTRSMRGDEPRRRPQKLSPEQRKAAALLHSIDTGMTLTRFQIESARKFDAAEGVEYNDFDHLIQESISTLSAIENGGDDPVSSASSIGVALILLVRAVDLLDKDVEDVATEALNDI